MCQICKEIFNLIFLKERTVLVFSLKIPYSSEDNKTEFLNCALHCNFCPWCQLVKSCLMHDYPYRRKLGKIFAATIILAVKNGDLISVNSFIGCVTLFWDSPAEILSKVPLFIWKQI